jgi:vanZ family protein
MVVKKIISDMWGSIWPMITFISIIAITLRAAYVFRGSKKFVLHKEILSWLFIVYVLCLYYIMMRSNNIGINFMPLVGLFENITKNYEFIIHNILIFLPLGFFSSYYLNNKKASMTFMISLIISALIEGMLYYLGKGFNIDIVILNIIGSFIGYLIYIGLMAIKGRLPKFMKSDTFINIILILLIILIVLFSLDINILNYL